MRRPSDPRPKSSTPIPFQLSPEQNLILESLRARAGGHGYVPYAEALLITLDILSRRTGDDVGRAEGERLLLGLTNEHEESYVRPLDVVPLRTENDTVKVLAFHEGPSGESLDEEARADVGRVLDTIRATLLKAPPYCRLFMLGGLDGMCRALGNAKG
jgi:hypothetical protein